MAFRDAHEAVANAVKVCSHQGIDLSEMSLEQLREACELKEPAMIQDDIFQVLTLEGSVNSRNHHGGTAPEQVLRAITEAKKRLEN